MKPLNVTIHMKATELCFPVLLFIMLCKVVLTFDSWIKSFSVTIDHFHKWGLVWSFLCIYVN